MIRRYSLPWLIAVAVLALAIMGVIIYGVIMVNAWAIGVAVGMVTLLVVALLQAVSFLICSLLGRGVKAVARAPVAKPPKEGRP